jgi:hypothetical protein
MCSMSDAGFFILLWSVLLLFTADSPGVQFASPLKFAKVTRLRQMHRRVRHFATARHRSSMRMPSFESFVSTPLWLATC